MFRKVGIPSLLFIVFLLSGCGPSLPTCAAGDLMPPDLTSPDWREVLDGSAAVLEWSYPDATCEPEGYQIILSRTRDYSVIDETGGTGNPSTSWSPGSPLLPAEEYFWRVAAVVGSTVGPYSQELRSFFTEPICDPAELVAPVPVLPENGGIFEIGYSSLEWEWPLTTCIPESYVIELSITEDYSDTSLFGATGSPGTRWGPGSPLSPATQYYWRLYASAGGTLGPVSIPQQFFTDPVCAISEMTAPDRLGPLDGDTLTDLNPIYDWEYPGTPCSPEGFHLQVSTYPDLSSPVTDIFNPIFGTSGFQPGAGLSDCQTYYWRVAMVSDDTTGPFSDIGTFSIDTTGSCSCDPGSIPTPDLVWPGPYEIISDTWPALEWSNPGSCDPEGYAVHLNTEYDFSGTSLGGGTGSPATSWSPGAPLDPATQYWWEVAGMVGTDSGDYSSPRSFFTGPECAYIGTVGTPVRLAPADGAELDTLTATLRYEPGAAECIPDGYFLNLQTDPLFGGTNLLGEFSLPATTVLTDPLTDCTRYFWKVAAVQDGSYGAESDVGWFYTNQSGTCPLPGIPGFLNKNTFCREGTYPEYFPAIYTFLAGDYLEAAARNPFGTYLQVYVPGQDSYYPIDPLELCWLPAAAVDLWGNQDELRGVNPPPTPTPVPLVCSQDLNAEQCKLAGGTWTQPTTRAGAGFCKCP